MPTFQCYHKGNKLSEVVGADQAGLKVRLQPCSLSVFILMISSAAELDFPSQRGLNNTDLLERGFSTVLYSQAFPYE